VQVSIEAQLKAMEINMNELDVVEKNRHTIMDITTFLYKGICISDLK
jgi:hypothetical protein